MSRADICGDPIGVKAIRGIALRGIVDNRKMKRLAEDVALAVPGVSDVQNRIRLRRVPF